MTNSFMVIEGNCFNKAAKIFAAFKYNTLLCNLKLYFTAVP